MDFLGIGGVLNKKGKGKEDAHVGIHPLIKVFSMGKEIGNSVSVSRDVFKVVIKVLEEFHPSGLLACDFLWLSEVLQVFMVCLDHDWMVGS